MGLSVKAQQAVAEAWKHYVGDGGDVKIITWVNLVQKDLAGRMEEEVLYMCKVEDSKREAYRGRGFPLEWKSSLCSCTQNTSLDAHTRTFFSCVHHGASSAHFQCGRTTLAQGEKSVRHFQCFTSISFSDVVIACSVRPLPFGPLLTHRIFIQTFSVYHIQDKELSKKPKRTRSLE